MLKVVGASWVQTMVSFCILMSIIIFGIFLILFVKYRKEDDGKYSATVYWNPYTEGFDIYLWGQNNDPEEVSRGTARAYYQPCMQETGWAVLEIETNGEYSDKIQAYAAGILEGSLSWQHIYWQWTNTIEQPCFNRQELCNDIRIFLHNNTSIIRRKAAEKGKTDPFWHQVNLFYIQLDGVEFGWKYEMKKNKQDYDIPIVDFMWMNMISEFKDLELSTTTNRSGINHSPVAMTLLKLLNKNNTDFLLAHASSGLYNSMLRIQKKYKFNYHWTARTSTKLVPGRTISFTSYPASIHSQDDFYQIIFNDQHSGEAKITVTGTAVNLNFQKNFNYTDQVLLGPRVMAANRLSRDGKFWSGILKSETHVLGNKQWMHILTKPNEMHFWVLEQTHLKTVMRNETIMLKKQGFWIHCGIPHYQEIQKESAPSSESPAAPLNVDSIAIETEKVLKAGQANITSLSSLINLLRGPDLSLVGRTDLHISPAEPAAFRTGQSLPLTSDPKSTQFVNYNKTESSYKIQLNETQLQILRLKKMVSVPQSLKDEFDSLVESKGHKPPKKPPVETKKPTFYSVNGIIDLKVTQNNNHFLAAAGPPFNVADKNRSVAPFQWSKSRINYLPHNGHADMWNYQPIVANFVWN